MATLYRPVASKAAAFLNENTSKLPVPSPLAALGIDEEGLLTPPPSTDEFARAAGLPEAGEIRCLNFTGEDEMEQALMARPPSIFSDDDDSSMSLSTFDMHSWLPIEPRSIDQTISLVSEMPPLSESLSASSSASISLSLSDDEEDNEKITASYLSYVSGYTGAALVHDSPYTNVAREPASLKRPRAGTTSAAEESDDEVSYSSKRARALAPSRPTGFAKTRGVNVEPAAERPPRVPVDVNPMTSATLPREALLHLTSADLNEFARQLELVRDLTADDRREIQRQRRLVKNRESAQLSRQRKKASIETLETAIAAERTAMDATRAQLAQLQAEIQTLTASLN